MKYPILTYFNYWFYWYLFRKADNPKWCADNTLIDWWERIICRYKGHPCGSVYYNPGGYEPDPKCIHCGDEIG